MKNFTIQLQDTKGEVVRENTLQLTEGDLLIVKYPESVTYEQVNQVFDCVEEALSKGKLLFIPEAYQINVLKKEGQA